VARPASLLIATTCTMDLRFDNIIALALAIHGMAAVVVNITATPKDNDALRRFYKVIEMFALVGPMAKR
jgi:hypothetical protein